MPLTEQEVLNILDNSNDGYYCHFAWLGHVYSYLIDSRCNVFRNDAGNWAVAIERLGYNPRAEAVSLEIYYFGNCLQDLDEYNGRISNIKTLYIFDTDIFEDSKDGEDLKPDAEYWVVRGQKLKLSHNKEDYQKADIPLDEFVPGAIGVEEAARLLILEHRDIFRATDQELYQCIPAELEKILVLDEWYHRDFQEQHAPILSDEHLKAVYEFNKSLTGPDGQDYETFVAIRRRHELESMSNDLEAWNNDRPGAYETWQQIAKVIVTGDASHYKPTLAPNTHWSNYPESGSL